jgi:DNA-directed RNA polymerase subunit M/transcription elongation factor TFIIS
MEYLSKKKENQQKILSFLNTNYSDEIDDIIYEMSFEKLNGKDLKTVFDITKNKKLGFNHENFEKISIKIIETDTFINKPFDMVEGVNECSKCHSKRTISYSKQTRSSDEGASVFVHCVDCKYRYMMNS